MKNMMIALIAAVGRDHAIGIGGRLPWHLHDDSIDYRKKILGFPLMMGRRTFEEIHKPYPDVFNVVISSTMKDLKGIHVCSNVEAGIELIQLNGFQTVFVIGGENIYRDALPFATDLYFTHVDSITPGADTFFPAIDWSQWVELPAETKGYTANHQNEYDFKICHYQRKPKNKDR
jgi:dihydrofolate reductase